MFYQKKIFLFDKHLIPDVASVATLRSKFYLCGTFGFRIGYFFNNHNNFYTKTIMIL